MDRQRPFRSGHALRPSALRSREDLHTSTSTSELITDRRKRSFVFPSLVTSHKELVIVSPRTAAVKRFAIDVLDAIAKEENSRDAKVGKHR